MNDLAKMYDLQKIDLAWTKVRRRLLQIQKLRGETKVVQEARESVAETEAGLHETRAKQTDAELESRALATRIKETEETLMGGKVRNPKELEALQANLESLRRHRASVEDSAVEAMMVADELGKELEEMKSSLSDLESEWESSQSELLEEETKLKRHYVILKRKREELASDIDDTWLNRYEQMRKRKSGVAIAPVENGVCSACHVQVPTGVMSTLHSSDGQPVICPSCGRYLYHN